MAWNLVAAYLTIAAVAAVIVYVLSNKVVDRRRPAAHRVPLSALAGLVWPLLLIGLVEFTSFAAYAKVHQDEDEDVTVLT